MVKNIFKSTWILITLLLLFGCTVSFGSAQIDENLSLQGSSESVGQKPLDNVAYNTSSSGIEEIAVGIVMDGKSARTDKIIKRIMKQVKLLGDDEFIVRFPKNKRLSGRWQKKGINRALSQLYQDSEVDIVMTIGISSSAVAATRQHHPKPTIATLVIDSKLGNIPFNGKSSGKNNLTYIGIQADLEEELKNFRKVVKFKHVTIITDALYGKVMPGLAKKGKKIAKKMHIRLSVLPHSSVKTDLSLLPKGTDAILLGALPRLNAKQIRKLIRALTRRGLPVYSLLSKEAVQDGALLSTVPEENWEQRTRRIALGIQGIVYGENPKDMDVIVAGPKRMTINMKTARQLNISPNFEVLLEADKLHEHKSNKQANWSLSKVAKRALRENIGIHASQLNQNIGTTYIHESRSRLLPQLSANLNQQYNKGNTIGSIAKQSTRAGVSLGQSLYDEKTWANYDIEKLKQVIRKSTHKQVELDTIRNATIAFLEVLKAQTRRDINEESIYLSRNNLDMAKDKSSVGAASDADVYRWETKLANDRANLLMAESVLQQAKENVNQILNRPITESFDVDTNIMQKPLLLVNDKRLAGYMRNAKNYRHFSNVLIRLGQKRSPQVAVYMTNLAIEKRVLTSEKRTDWIPTVTAKGEYSYMINDSRSDIYMQEGNDDWSVGINFSLPLYEGGAKRERKERSKIASMQLKLELENTNRTVEQIIRANLHTVKASKLSIDLNKISTKAAQKNFELISESYSVGSASVIELIDAQNSKIVAELNLMNSTYQFLMDLMNLQHATGGFDFFLNQGERDYIVREISKKIKRGS